jgi:uncharacterized protein (TIGR02453 family)
MATVPTAFAGLPEEGFAFYAALATNNTREWWHAHKGEYEATVREPLTALVDALADEFGEAKVFRPYRNTRFSKDKTPIKEHQGAVVMVEDGMGYYVQVGAEGLMTGGGWYVGSPKQTARYRAAVEGPAGAELERMVRAAGRRFTVDGDPVRTRPRGVDPDHPRFELLRFRRLVVTRTHEPSAALATKRALTIVRDDWRAARPVIEWLGDRVGPSSEPD